MGISIAVALIVPLVLGVLVDNFLKSSPFGVLVGLLVGVISLLLHRSRSVQAIHLTRRWSVSRRPIDIVALV